MRDFCFMTVKNDIPFVLGLDSGYMARQYPSLSGVFSGAPSGKGAHPTTFFPLVLILIQFTRQTQHYTKALKGDVLFRNFGPILKFLIDNKLLQYSYI